MILKLFFDPSREVAVAANLGAKSTSFPHLVVRMTFARAETPACNKVNCMDNCYTGHRQTNYLINGRMQTKVNNNNN